MEQKRVIRGALEAEWQAAHLAQQVCVVLHQLAVFLLELAVPLLISLGSPCGSRILVRHLPVVPTSHLPMSRGPRGQPPFYVLASFLGVELHPVVLRADYWLSAQGSLLVVWLRGPYMVLGIEPIWLRARRTFSAGRSLQLPEPVSSFVFVLFLGHIW